MFGGGVKLMALRSGAGCCGGRWCGSDADRSRCLSCMSFLGIKSLRSSWCATMLARRKDDDRDEQETSRTCAMGQPRDRTSRGDASHAEQNPQERERPRTKINWFWGDALHDAHLYWTIVSKLQLRCLPYRLKDSLSPVVHTPRARTPTPSLITVH